MHAHNYIRLFQCQLPVAFTVHLYKYVVHIIISVSCKEAQKKGILRKKTRQKQLPSLKCNICVSLQAAVPNRATGALLNYFFIQSQNTFVNQPSRNTRTSCQETLVQPSFSRVTNANKQFQVTKMTALSLNAPLKALCRETGNVAPHSFMFLSLIK